MFLLFRWAILWFRFWFGLWIWVRMRRRGRGFGRLRIIVHRTAALLALALGRMLLRCGFRCWLWGRCWLWIW